MYVPLYSKTAEVMNSFPSTSRSVKTIDHNWMVHVKIVNTD